MDKPTLLPFETLLWSVPVFPDTPAAWLPPWHSAHHLPRGSFFASSKFIFFISRPALSSSFQWLPEKGYLAGRFSLPLEHSHISGRKS